MNCRLCIFLENGKVYGYFTTNKMIGLHESNYGTYHKIELIGIYTKEEIKKMHPHASFITFDKLGKNRLERIKIIDLENQ